MEEMELYLENIRKVHSNAQGIALKKPFIFCKTKTYKNMAWTEWKSAEQSKSNRKSEVNTSASGVAREGRWRADEKTRKSHTNKTSANAAEDALQYTL